MMDQNVQIFSTHKTMNKSVNKLLAKNKVFKLLLRVISVKGI